jgi:hypothetical protein
MSCIHIQGKRRSVKDCAPFRFLSPSLSERRSAGVRANACSSNPKIRAAAASSHSVDRATLVQLADDPVGEVREWVARNETAPADVLRHLAGDEDERVRAYVAWNPHTPSDVINLLAQDLSLVVKGLAQSRFGEQSGGGS